MINISASLISDFISCKRKAYYRINFPEQAIQTDDMMVGEIIHRTLQETWDTTLFESLEYAFNLVKTYRILDPNIQRMSKIRTSLETFYSQWKFYLTNDDIIEKFFKVKYSNDVNIVGKMDRITKGGVIIDWKTDGRNITNLDNKVQFIIYYKSYEQLFGEPPKAVYLAHLTKPQNSLIEFKPNPFYINNLYQEVIPEIVKEIKNKKFSRVGLYNGSCYNCQFQPTCWSE